MIIALIHWRIKDSPTSEEAFLTFWNQEARVRDRSGLIGEFLSHAESREKLPYITWDLDDRLGEYRSFVNVAIWKDETDFEEQIAIYFDDTQPMKPFEHSRRIRTVLKPQCWRIGESVIPKQDTDGTI